MGGVYIMKSRQEIHKILVRKLERMRELLDQGIDMKIGYDVGWIHLT